jgi:hypothetical protein
MLTSLCGRCLGILAVVCVLLLLFFPLMSGPFPATHGPVTALRARRYFLALLFSMITASRRCFTALLPVFRVLLPLCQRSGEDGPEAVPMFCSRSVLRC